MSPRARCSSPAVADDGKIGANRGVAANGAAKVESSGTDQVFTVPFTGDLSKCVATASPAGGGATDRLVVGAPATNGTIVVTEQNPAAAYGFTLQVTC